MASWSLACALKSKVSNKRKVGFEGFTKVTAVIKMKTSAHQHYNCYSHFHSRQLVPQKMIEIPGSVN